MGQSIFYIDTCKKAKHVRNSLLRITALTTAKDEVGKRECPATLVGQSVRDSRIQGNSTWTCTSSPPFLSPSSLDSAPLLSCAFILCPLNTSALHGVFLLPA